MLPTCRPHPCPSTHPLTPTLSSSLRSRNSKQPENSENMAAGCSCGVCVWVGVRRRCCCRFAAARATASSAVLRQLQRRQRIVRCKSGLQAAGRAVAAAAAAVPESLQRVSSASAYWPVPRCCTRGRRQPGQLRGTHSGAGGQGRPAAATSAGRRRHRLRAAAGADDEPAPSRAPQLLLRDLCVGWSCHRPQITCSNSKERHTETACCKRKAPRDAACLSCVPLPAHQPGTGPVRGGAGERAGRGGV